MCVVMSLLYTKPLAEVALAASVSFRVMLPYSIKSTLLKLNWSEEET